MARNINSRRIHSKNEAATETLSALSADDLKAAVRDGLVAMNMTMREDFIRTLEAEIRRAGLNMRAYLVPLGIPGRSPEDLTPTEVAHLIRFLKLNVPRAMPAIERALTPYDVFSDHTGGKGHRIAA
ncbi:MAG: hypothetical protein WAV20_15390 [Blastocatellia bacterium]